MVSVIGEMGIVSTTPCHANNGWIRSKRFRQAGLPQDCICGMPTGDSDRHDKVAPRNRALPDFVTAPALPDKRASRLSQQISQQPIERRRHSGRRRSCFAQGRNLDENRGRIDIGKVVRRQIERHLRYFVEQFVERGRVGGGGDFVAMSAPDGGLVVPDRRHREYDRP